MPAAVERVQADRRDVAALARLFEGADAIVDLLGFDEADADLLLEAVARCRNAPRHLVFASSIAELGGGPRFSEGRGRPADRYGEGKLAARRRCEERFAGRVHSLVLPRLVAAVDPGRREASYLESALGGGRALVAGDGSQLQTIAPVDGVAEVVRRLCEQPERVPAGPLHVGPPAPVAVGDAVAALLAGAGIAALVARHPSRTHRGPHPPGAELLETPTLQRAFPDLLWPDVLAVHRDLGAFLVRSAAERRPTKLVAHADKAFLGRRLIDVHGRRETTALAAPLPELHRLAGWLSPAFYLDLGRPCNSACLYCAVPPHADTQGFTPVSRLAAEIEVARAAGLERAIFVGGEPTISPALPEALALLRGAGLAGGHVVMSNGVRLSDPAFLAGLVAGGVGTLHLSIDTSDPLVADRLSRSPGQFPRQREGLHHALRQPGLQLYVYAVATRVNAASLPAHLRELAALAAAAGVSPPPLVVAFVKPQGDALLHASALLLSPEERVALARTLAAEARAAGVPLGLRNLQACLAPELLPHLIDYYLEDYSIEVETRRRVAFGHHDENLRVAAACEACAHRGLCPGAYREDLARHGEASLHGLDATGLARAG